MTRKHYEAVAACIRAEMAVCEAKHATGKSGAVSEGAGGMNALFDVANRLADRFAAMNSAFHKGRFLTACGF